MKRLLTITLMVLLCTQSFAKRAPEMSAAEREAIIAKADTQLSGKEFSVTYKTAPVPSGDNRDYVSMGPYWWPDPAKEDGLPYIRRDGEINPEYFKNYPDLQNLKGVIAAVNDLRKGYDATANRDYTARAEHLLRTFFIDEVTGMNPNLNFGQFVPGLNSGRCFGIIELGRIPELLNDVEALERTKGWDKELASDMKVWMGDMLEWLLTSEIGTEERETLNNHGTYYDRLCAAIYIYIGEKKSAKEHIIKYTLPRLPQQVEADGSLPEELARTKSWNYSTMDLKGFMDIAALGERVGYDLWSYSNGEQVYIKSMIDWFIPYVKGEKEWTWRQIKKTNITTTIIPLFRIAAEKYNDASYLEIEKNLHDIDKNIIAK